jgi:hypothetical protein
MCQARLNLLAHSMGNYVLRNAVQAIISEFGGKRLPRAFTHIFLMAADMAADEDDDALNDTDKLARLPEMAEAVHVYFAANDRALSISDITKGNPDRLGSAGPHTLTNLPQKITLIDCDQVCETTLLDANHQYYRKRPEVLADICAVLDGTRPGVPLWSRPSPEPGSVHPQVQNMLRVGLQFAPLDLFHDLGQRRIGGRGNAQWGGAISHEAIEELDLSAATLHHILPHGGAMRAAAGTLGNALAVIFGAGLRIALASAGDHLRVDMQDFFQ